MLLKEALEYENIIKEYSNDYNFCNINLNVAVNIYVKEEKLKELTNRINFKRIDKLKGRHRYLLTF